MPEDNGATSLFGWPIELISVLISAVIGFLTGLLGINYQRWLDRKGKIECHIEDLQVELKQFSLDDRSLRMVKTASTLQEATDIDYMFNCVLRNHKNIDIEVREPRLVFKSRYSTWTEDKIYGAAIKGSHTYESEDIRFILLTKGQTKSFQLRGNIKAAKYREIYQARTTCELVFNFGKARRVRKAINLL